MPILKRPPEGELFYEVHGKVDAPPVLILNGIMMSTLSWKSFIDPLVKHFRLILLDFRDQGKSTRENAQYSISLHVEDTLALLDHLEIERVNVVGLSYGGQVAQLLAIEECERVNSLVLANTPARISPYLAELGEAWKEAAKLRDGEKFFALAIPFIYSDYFYNHNLDWLKARQKLFKDLLNDEWFEGFTRLASSNPDFDVLDRLHRINCPTLLLGADRDIITPVNEMELIHQRVAGSEFLIVHNAGHGAFLEKPKEFITAVTGFIRKNA